MAIEHSRMCGSCDRECPSWADRCPACGNSATFRRIVVIPSAPSFQRAEPVTLITSKIAARKRAKTLKTPADGASEVSAR